VAEGAAGGAARSSLLEMASLMATDEQPVEALPSKARRRLLILAALVGGSALILLAARSGSLDYYRDVDSLVSSQALQPDHPVRVKGTVALGSVERDLASGRTRFVLRGRTQSIEVLFTGDPPPLFAAGREVVVAGYARPGAPFEAYELMTKCPSKYEARREGE